MNLMRVDFPSFILHFFYLYFYGTLGTQKCVHMECDSDKTGSKINIYNNKKIDKRDEGAPNPVYIPYHSL